MILNPRFDDWDSPTPASESLLDRLADVARSCGSQVALQAFCEPTSALRYAELLSATDRPSRAIAGRAGMPGRVALLMQHDLDQAVAVIAVLRAGRMVVVLNPSDAPARLRAVLDDADPSLLIADVQHRELAQTIAGGLCAIALWDEIAAESADVEPPAISANATAFVVYTSGSSGRPKGVMLNHLQVMHNAWRLSAAMRLSASDRVALLPSLSGLHGVNTLWCALLRGAALLPFPVMERGVTALANWMTDQGITAFSASTSLFRSFMRSLPGPTRIDPVRVVRIGGELATSDDVAGFRRHFHRDAVLINTLASSEAGNIAYLRLNMRDPVPEGPLAVGRAFDGVAFEIVDEHGRTTSAGEAGEIVVKSPFLAQGYWRDDALTSARFFRGADGTPMLRSGDWGRINGDGNLEFFGRRDRRVKIHGNTVELDEVEMALSRITGVERAVICTFEGAFGTELAAYVAARSGFALTNGLLRRAARNLLPWHMVPAVFQIVADMPLMPHGKIDRAKLLQASPPLNRQHAAAALETETEALIASLWSDAFGLTSVGREDDFFDLGGDSLTASVIAARLFGETGVELDLASFSDFSTVARQAQLVDKLSRETAEYVAIRRVQGRRVFPLSFTQERIWRFCQDDVGAARYSLLKQYRISGPLDIELLRWSMNALIRRHELLRTTFRGGEDGPLQIVHAAGDVALTVVDATDATDQTELLSRHARQLSAEKLDLERGPLARFLLVKIADGEFVLLRRSHHIIYDGFASRAYFEELAKFYEMAVAGQELAAADAVGVQYGDYASWQRRHFSAAAPAGRRMVGWWLKILDSPAASLRWPPERPAPAQANSSDAEVYAGLSQSAWQEMSSLADHHRVTTYCAWLATFAAFLCAQAGTRDVAIGSYVSNRTRPELQRVFGDFSNLVTLRFRCDLNQSFRAWLMTTRDILVAAIAHAALPYEELRRAFEQEGRTLPEIRCIAAFEEPQAPIRFGGIELSEERRHQVPMPWGFTFTVSQRASDCRYEFDASRYDPVAVRREMTRWKGFAEALCHDPDTPMQAALTSPKLWVSV